MRTKNYVIKDFVQYVQGKDIYVYGLGDIFTELRQSDFYANISNHIKGYIDQGKAGTTIEDTTGIKSVKDASFLKEVEYGVVLICSTKYLDEMYENLCSLSLPDSIDCFILPFIWAASDGEDDSRIKEFLNRNQSDKRIQKEINCFWFSKDKKPEKYQNCIDSWKRVCPDYRIIEWNADNYDCEKNKFVKQAYEKRKWAFISDFARLDVIYQNGGIYLDMDVELIKNFDPLLQCRSFFSFGTKFYIDLGSGFGSIKKNPFIGELLKLYDDQDFIDQNGNPLLQKFVQPAFIRNNFIQEGFQMNGDMQMIDEMLLLPRKYYAPLDDFTLYNYLQCEDTRGIHKYNAGWCTDDFCGNREKILQLLINLKK